MAGRNIAKLPLRRRDLVNALTRNRASLGISNEKSVSKNSRRPCAACRYVSYTSCTSLCTSAGIDALHVASTRTSADSRRQMQSDALFFHRKARSCAISTAIYGLIGWFSH